MTFSVTVSGTTSTPEGLAALQQLRDACARACQDLAKEQGVTVSGSYYHNEGGKSESVNLLTLDLGADDADEEE